jgi:hypothetical protein
LDELGAGGLAASSGDDGVVEDAATSLGADA